MAKSDLHVVMLPWSAFGHLVPFLQLSIALAKNGVKVSFVSTPRNIQRLPKIDSPIVASRINFVEIPLPPMDDPNLLPEGAEATIDIPGDKIQYLKTAYDKLKHPFKKFVAANESLNWIIVDFASPWAGDISKEFNIPLLIFSVFSCALRVFTGSPENISGEGQRKFKGSPESLTSPPEWIDFPSSIALRSHEADKYHPAFYGENASGIRDCERIAKTLRSCQAVAIRSCTEFEGEYLSLYEKIIGKPVIPVGLLPRDEKPVKDIVNGRIFEWLDIQKQRSVLFVGFGSECKLTKEQVYEIGYGLEIAELPFIWPFRKPNWAIDITEALPPGFIQRTSDRGLVHMGWAPQVEILGHLAIGGSLFHSGWGSVIETLQFGHTLVVLPFIVDQPINARLLVEKGLAVEVDRKKDGSFTREDVAKALRLAMVLEEGEPLRSKAREAAAVFGDTKLHQDHYISTFVDFLKNGGIN